MTNRPNELRHRGPRPKAPGSNTLRKSDVDAMIRVDHAGEFGALRIYQGQLAVLGRKAGAPVEAIRRMADQEEKHFAAFEKMVKDRRVRPTALEPVWSVAGFALGAFTAMLGANAALACTVAVEDVIDGHYRNQIETMPERESELRTVVTNFRGDELEHRELAIDHGARDAPAYRLLTSAIRACCRTAIALSEKI
jgi:ubiquinone biosynthesis monooxygenase Coq7